MDRSKINKENDMDVNQKAKTKVLQQLIEMMDEKQLEGLKSKSPKFAKADIMSDDPELAESLEDKTKDDGFDPEAPEADEAKDDKFPAKELVSIDDAKMESEEEPEADDDDMKRLREMYEKLK